MKYFCAFILCDCHHVLLHVHTHVAIVTSYQKKSSDMSLVIQVTTHM